MNTYQLAEDFRAAFAGSPLFGFTMLHGQDAGEFTAPCAVFSLTEEPFSGDGRAAKVTLAVEVHSPSAVEAGAMPADEAHTARVSAVREMLMGSGKADLLQELNALGRWKVKGWSAAGEDPDRQGQRFFTPVRIIGTVIELAHTERTFDVTP